MKKFIEFLVENEEIDREEVWRTLGHNNFEIINRKVNVYQNVLLSNKSLKSILFNFGIVNGDFNCSDNQLTSLEGCPKEINGSFNCYNNKLTSLEECPKEINGDFNCSKNQLISLKGCPRIINENFNCSKNQLTSLEGCPNKVNKDFDCYNNKLTSLKGCPRIINEDFNCSNNQLTSLEGCPNKITWVFDCRNNPLIDISDIVGKEIKYLSCDLNKLNITIGNLKALKQININKVNWYLDTDSEEELQLYAIKKDPKNIRKIPDILDSIIEMIKREYPELIIFTI